MILDIIDIRDIAKSRPPYNGNFNGLAYNPAADVLYLARGHAPGGGFIHTIDLSGTVLDEWDFEAAYASGMYPGSLSFHNSHLFVAAGNISPPYGIDHVVEMSPDGATIFDEFAPPQSLFFTMHVRADGVWLTKNTDKKVYRLNLSGAILSSFALDTEDSFPNDGPAALTSSFTGSGFLLVDHHGKRLVLVSSSGAHQAAVSTANLGDGRGLAIDTDIAGGRIFLQVNNQEIYVLSDAFI